MNVRHKFCRACGVQSFYHPRSNPGGVGIMPHCVTSDTILQQIIVSFDGNNWDEAFKKDKIVKSMA